MWLRDGRIRARFDHFDVVAWQSHARSARYSNYLNFETCFWQIGQIRTNKRNSSGIYNKWWCIHSSLTFRVHGSWFAASSNLYVTVLVRVYPSASRRDIIHINVIWLRQMVVTWLQISMCLRVLFTVGSEDLVPWPRSIWPPASNLSHHEGMEANHDCTLLWYKKSMLVVETTKFSSNCTQIQIEGLFLGWQ